jgi:hypothetical protein
MVCNKVISPSKYSVDLGKITTWTLCPNLIFPLYSNSSTIALMKVDFLVRFAPRKQFYFHALLISWYPSKSSYPRSF